MQNAEVLVDGVVCGTLASDHAQHSWATLECNERRGLVGTTIKVKPATGKQVEFCGIKAYGHQAASYAAILPDRKQGVTIAVDP